jgi:hypothetical protein
MPLLALWADMHPHSEKRTKAKMRSTAPLQSPVTVEQLLFTASTQLPTLNNPTYGVFFADYSPHMQVFNILPAFLARNRTRCDSPLHKRQSTAA